MEKLQFFNSILNIFLCNNGAPLVSKLSIIYSIFHALKNHYNLLGLGLMSIKMLKIFNTAYKLM